MKSESSIHGARKTSTLNNVHKCGYKKIPTINKQTGSSRRLGSVCLVFVLFTVMLNLMLIVT